MQVKRVIAGRYRSKKYHTIHGGGFFTSCGKDSDGWLEDTDIDMEAALEDPQCCTNCKHGMKDFKKRQPKGKPYLAVA